MTKEQLRVLFIGDIVGEPGLDLVKDFLPELIKKRDADFVIANGENSHEGKGINRYIIQDLYDLGVNVITGGNHSFAKWKVYDYMKSDPNILRPLNYPKGNVGYGYTIYELSEIEKKIAVLNLQGRTFMPAIDDPFTTADWALKKIKKETDLIFIDFHAEATAEKMALAWYLDGSVSVIVGTHTHIPTNDARILEKGTGYISDAGMTGSFNSVLGMNSTTSIKRFKLGTPHKYKLAKGNNHLCAVESVIDTQTAECLHIEPILYPELRNSKLNR
jgi:metallophosphoesterase (TIGR00282 family)